MGIVVKELESGDFQVVNGGDVYRNRVYRGRPSILMPDFVSAGDIVSAGEICEWVSNGVAVDHRPTVNDAALDAALQTFHRKSRTHTISASLESAIESYLLASEKIENNRGR